ncbi:MAG: T9SS type A sorting domain-containing protein [Candidatus Marinimicrobia bacterium]|nr:T9SS type A sorting domain-containing protein [Candidatus Neomarinimicrobiota bacterium]
MKGILIRTAKIILACLLVSGVGMLRAEPGVPGIHRQQWEFYRQFEKETVCSEPEPEIYPLNKAAALSRYLKKDVFGYLPYWERTSAPQYFRYNLLSQIAVFGWTVGPAGNLTPPSGWPYDWAAMINKAHQYGVKVVMCMIEFDDDEMHTLITNQSNTRNFINNVISEMETYQLDGVNIDFEGPKNEDRGAVINTFMKQLTDSVHTRLGTEYEVSFAGPAVNWGERWNLAGLADACDYIFIMGYSFWGSWSSTAGPTAPLSGTSNNITTTVTDDYGSADPGKLILGVPYYGNRWQTADGSEGSASVDYIGSLFYRSAKDLFSRHGKIWSVTYQVPWGKYISDSQWYQFWCDDAQSLGLKYNLVDAHALRGSGMWALGYDGVNMELWNLLAERYYDFPREEILAGFDDSLGKFNTHPTYSGSTKGISSDSYAMHDSSQAFSGTGSGQWVLKDDATSSADWQVRILSDKGDRFLNRGFSSNGVVTVWLKTSAPAGKSLALIVDDMAGGTEISDPQMIIGDGGWHAYRFDLFGEEWASFSGGNGIPEGPILTLDAIMLYSPDQPEDWVLNMDEIRYDTHETQLVSTLPEFFELRQNYPNPFNGETVIPYVIHEAGRVTMALYDIRGRFVRQLVDGYHAPGMYSVRFSAENLSNGTYIYRLTGREASRSSKMILLK